MRVLVDPEREAEIRRKMHSATMAANLIRASLVITAAEMLKDSALASVRSFFAREWVDGEPVESPEWERKVRNLSPTRNRVDGTLLWLQQVEALSAEQVEAFKRLRAARHELAHDLARILVDADRTVDVKVVAEAVEVGKALAVFWGGIEVDINPGLAGVDPSGIEDGVSLLMAQLASLTEVADVIAGFADLPDSATG